MTRIVLAGLLALSALSLTGTTANAQCGYPQFGCGGFCLTMGRSFHAHGPLYSYANYGIPNTGWGYGYGGGAGYGHGCFGANRAPMSRGFIGGGGFGGLFHGGLFNRNDCNSCGGGGYALSTFKNIFHRINPLSGRGCGTGCSMNASCGNGCAGGCSGGCK